MLGTLADLAGSRRRTSSSAMVRSRDCAREQRVDDAKRRRPDLCHRRKVLRRRACKRGGSGAGRRERFTRRKRGEQTTADGRDPRPHSQTFLPRSNRHVRVAHFAIRPRPSKRARRSVRMCISARIVTSVRAQQIGRGSTVAPGAYVGDNTRSARTPGCTRARPCTNAASWARVWFCTRAA